MSTRSTDDFYEDDEPVADVRRAFESAEKHLTAPTRRVNEVSRLAPSIRGLTETLRVPESLRWLAPRKDVPTSSAHVARA